MPLVSGTTAAGFNIVRPLGSGESIELYLASHPRLPRQQLLYMIQAEVSADLDYRERFHQESDLAAGLLHPNIVSLTDRGEFEDQLWISTDYVEGDDAAQLLADGFPDGMPPKLVIEIVSAIAEALDYAHDEGVLHRYVNPSNIFVGNSPSGRRRIALGGFGVARRLGETNTLTRAGMFIGTASYTAPEQLIDEAIDGRADQYALAASAFHLLTGSPPFAHFNPAVVINKHLNDEPPRPSDVRSELTDFDAIFGRALAKDPVDRFRRSRDFAKALEGTGGTRSHFLGASAFLEASNHKEVEAPAFLATRTNDVAPPTEVAGPVTPDAVAPPTAPAPTTPARPATVRNKHVAPSLNHLPNKDVDDVVTSVEPASDVAADDDDDAREAKRRRTLHAAALGGVILVVVVAWFAGVRALRSASESHDTPTSADNTTTGPAIPLAPPPSAIAPPPPVVTPPPAPVAPPQVQTTPLPAVTTPPAPVATTPSTTKPSPPPTTTAPANSPTSPPTTTKARSTTPTSPALDTRPAIGMPCSPDQAGSSTVSNSGGPVSCVDTPGGSAWEPPTG